jgi:purine-binding chemotaxis protein CheW
VFEVGGGAFACEMESFREIVPTQAMTRLPGASSAVCGLINLRGTIVTVIDGGIALGKPGYARAGGLILLLDHFERWIGIGVDDVRDIQDVPIDQFSSADAAETSQPGITGAVEIEGRRVLVLDIKAVVEQVIGQREAR